MSFLYRLVRKGGKLGRTKTPLSPLAAHIYEGFDTERTPLSTEPRWAQRLLLDG
jgi:hypothetical protein